MQSERSPESGSVDQELLQRRRKQIAHAALAVFAEKGFHKAGMRDVARQAGVSVGAIYDYVKNKEDLLCLACDQGTSEYNDQLRETLSAYSDPLEKLKAAIKTWFAIMDSLDKNVILYYRESQSLDDAGRRMLMAREEDSRRIFEEILSEGVDTGVFRVENIKLIAHTILIAGHMWGLKRWSFRKYLDLREYTQLQTRFILSGILAK